LLGDLLRVVVVDAGLDGLVVLGGGTGAVAFGIVGVAAFDVCPDFDPRRLEVAVDGGLKIIERRVVVALFEIDQAEVVVDP
jgi:predicted RNA methylase